MGPDYPVLSVGLFKIQCKICILVMGSSCDLKRREKCLSTHWHILYVLKFNKQQLQELKCQIAKFHNKYDDNKQFLVKLIVSNKQAMIKYLISKIL